MSVRKAKNPAEVWRCAGLPRTSPVCVLKATGDRRRGVIILASVARSVDDFGFAILRSDWPLPPRHPDITLTADQLDDYVDGFTAFRSMNIASGRSPVIR